MTKKSERNKNKTGGETFEGAKNNLSSPSSIRKKCLSPAREIAIIAVMTALLIGGQAALSIVAGVEIVTVILLCFSWKFGPRAGVLTAFSFSLLRCFLWGFYPSVIVLYIVYYPLFALIFGSLGKISGKSYERFPLWAALLVNFALSAIMFGSAFCALTSVLNISRLALAMVRTLLWVIFALCGALLLLFDTVYILRKCGVVRRADILVLVLAAAVAAVCTISFSLLDDVITPVFMGWNFNSVTTAAYFYGSFLALAPQTVCTIVTVTTMFFPLCAVFGKVAGKTQ